MGDNISQTFYCNVRNICTMANISIGYIEKRCNLPSGYISRWRKRGMPLYEASKIAKELGVPVDVLVNDNLNLNDIKELVKERIE